MCVCELAKFGLALSLSILNQSQRNRNNLISGRLTTNSASVGRIALDIEQDVRLAVGNGCAADLLHGVIVKVHPDAVVDRERCVVAAAGAGGGERDLVSLDTF